MDGWSVLDGLDCTVRRWVGIDWSECSRLDFVKVGWDGMDRDGL